MSALERPDVQINLEFMLINFKNSLKTSNKQSTIKPPVNQYLFTNMTTCLKEKRKYQQSKENYHKKSRGQIVDVLSQS